MEKRNLSINAEIRATGGPKPKIVGHIPYNSLSVRIENSFNERIMPGAFKDSIKNDAIMAYWSHDVAKPIASTDGGSLILRDGASGLDITMYPNLKVSWAKDAYESVKSGNVRGFSFGFVTEKDRWNKDNSVRELEKVKLYEISPVTMPAYKESAINARGVRSLKNMETRELNKERGEVHEEWKRLRDIGYKNLNTEQQDEYGKLERRYDELCNEIEANTFRGIRPDVSGDGTLYRYGGSYTIDGDTIDLRKIFPDIASRGEVVKHQLERSTERELRLFERYLKGGSAVLSAEQRSLFMDNDLQGGFLVSPQKFVANLIQDTRDETYALRECTVYPAEGAQSLGAPSLDAEPDDSLWSAELSTGDEDTAMRMGKRELHPHPLAKRIKVSKKLLRAAPNVDAIVRDALKYKLAVPIESAWMTGDGVNKPLGVFVDSDMGITSARDVSTGNTTTAIKADNLIECKYALKPQYLKNAKWIFHRDVVKAIRKLKTGSGDYIWRSGISADKPDTILDIPFLQDEYAPNTFSAGQYVGIIGDFKRGYWFAVALNMQIQVLVELYAEQNQNGYVARAELDGMPVIEDAFCRVTLSS